MLVFCCCPNLSIDRGKPNNYFCSIQRNGGPGSLLVRPYRALAAVDTSIPRASGCHYTTCSSSDTNNEEEYFFIHLCEQRLSALPSPIVQGLPRQLVVQDILRLDLFVAPAAKVVEDEAWQGKPTGMALRAPTFDVFMVC